MVKKLKISGLAIFLVLSMIFLLSCSNLVSASWLSDMFHDHDDDYDDYYGSNYRVVKAPQILVYQQMLNNADGYDIAWNGPYKNGNLVVTMYKEPKPVCYSSSCSYNTNSRVNYDMPNNNYYGYSAPVRYTRSNSVSVRDTSRSSSSAGSNSGMYVSSSFG